MQSLFSQDSSSSKELLTCSADRHADSPEYCYGAFKAQKVFPLIWKAGFSMHFWDKGQGTSLLWFQAISAEVHL